MLSVIDIVLLCLVHSSTVQRLVTSEEGTCLHDVPSKGDNEHYPNRVILENAGLPPMTDILIQMNLCREDGLCQASQAAVVLPVARWREKSRTN